MAKPVSEWVLADLEALIGSAEESSSLEFKDARSLENTPEKKREIAKDVSAMANSAGGIIVYGIKAKGGVADAFAGFEADLAKADWFDQFITNNIEPKVQGVVIHRIDLADDKMALLIDVPPATTFAPHQSKSDQRYYRRYNATILTMLDHEIRDLMRRSSSPDLYVRVTFFPMFENVMLDDGEMYFTMRVYYGNRSREPALYSRVELILDDAFQSDYVGGWDRSNVDIAATGKGKVFGKSFMVPNHLPIMAEREECIFETTVVVDYNRELTFGFILSAPGFRTAGSWVAERLARNKAAITRS